MQLIRTSQFILTGMKHFTKRAQPFPALEQRLNGLVVMVTGATAGLGLGIATDMAQRGATLHLVCRSKERGEAVVKDLIDKTKNENIHLHLCDLSSIKDVKTLAETFLRNEKSLNVLINNAGCMINAREFTAEGLEKNFATNTLGTYYLTKLLVPLLKLSRPAKVITISSGGMLTQPLVLKDLFMVDSDFDGAAQYSVTKRHQVVLTEWWARCYFEQGVSFYSMHPGWVETDGVKTSMPEFHKKFEKDLRPIDQGIDTVIWLTVSSEKNLQSGEFYFDRAVADKHLTIASTSYDEEKADSLIGRLEGLLAKLGY